MDESTIHRANAAELVGTPPRTHTTTTEKTKSSHHLSNLTSVDPILTKFRKEPARSKHTQKHTKREKANLNRFEVNSVTRCNTKAQQSPTA